MFFSTLNMMRYKTTRLPNQHTTHSFTVCKNFEVQKKLISIPCVRRGRVYICESSLFFNKLAMNPGKKISPHTRSLNELYLFVFFLLCCEKKQFFFKTLHLQMIDWIYDFRWSFSLVECGRWRKKNNVSREL